MKPFNKTTLFQQKYLPRIEALRQRTSALELPFLIQVVYREDPTDVTSSLTIRIAPNRTPGMLQVLGLYEQELRKDNPDFEELRIRMLFGFMLSQFPLPCQHYTTPETKELQQIVQDLGQDLHADEIPFAIIIGIGAGENTSQVIFAADTTNTWDYTVLAAMAVHEIQELDELLDALTLIYTGQLTEYRRWQ